MSDKKQPDRPVGSDTAKSVDWKKETVQADDGRYVKVPIEMHLEMTRQFGNEYSIHDMLSYLFIKVQRLNERA